MTEHHTVRADQPGRRPTLDQFIARLLVLQAQGAGSLPVLVETRSREGQVIYAQANARQDVVEHQAGRYRKTGTSAGQAVAVVRVG